MRFFKTPVTAVKTPTSLNTVQYPSSWIRAVNSEKSRGDTKGFIFNQQDKDNELSRMWLTETATNISLQGKTSMAPIPDVDLF